MTTLPPPELLRAIRLCQRGGATCQRLFHRLLGAEDAVDQRLVTAGQREAEDLLLVLENASLVSVSLGTDARPVVRVKNRGALVFLAADVERGSALIVESEKRTPVRDEARFVATLPGAAQDLVSSSIRPSATSFTGIAHSAEQRLAIVMPFLDERGINVFKAMSAVAGRKKVKLLVISRSSANARWEGGIERIASMAGAQNVEVLTPVEVRPDGATKDLVHAKIILADAHSAYVGSANLTGGGMVDTIEAGVILRGPCVEAVAEFVQRLAEWGRARQGT